MNQAPDAMPGAQPVLASARESAFYDAGYQAGRMAELLRAQAIAGAICVQLTGFARSAINLRQRTSADVNLLRRKEGKPRAVLTDLDQVADLCEMLRGSMLTTSIENDKQATVAAQEYKLAQQKFAEAIARAQALAGKPSVIRRALENILRGLP